MITDNNKDNEPFDEFDTDELVCIVNTIFAKTRQTQQASESVKLQELPAWYHQLAKEIYPTHGKAASHFKGVPLWICSTLGIEDQPDQFEVKWFWEGQEYSVGPDVAPPRVLSFARLAINEQIIARRDGQEYKGPQR